jgi:hypothetical protein
MKLFTKMNTLLGIFLISLFLTTPAMAFPPLPSSFYGTVKVDAANVPDGTSIQALINGKVIVEAKSLTYQGDSVYTLDVLGDDTDTSVVDGGRDGDKIIFTIAGQVAEQTGTWRGGTNVVLNLSVPRGASQNELTSTLPAAANPQNGSAGSAKTPTIIGIVVVLLLIITLWLILARKPRGRKIPIKRK